MKKEKSSKRPLIYYYIIVVLCLMLINSLVVPWFAQRQVQLVDYNTFLDMTQQQQIGLVEVQEDQIVFTNKDNTAIYKTGRMEDPALVERLIDSGARFSQEIVEEMSPLTSLLLYWILPMLIFIGIGQWMSRRMLRKGGGGGMPFGLGKSGAKEYDKSSEGIRFADVAGEDEAKESLAEIVDYLHDPDKYKQIIKMLYAPFKFVSCFIYRMMHIRKSEYLHKIIFFPEYRHLLDMFTCNYYIILNIFDADICR